MISVLCLIGIFMALGIIVQFTSVFDKKRYTEEEIKNIKIEHRKSKLGLAFFAFSPANNIVKLFTIGKPPDENLTVLNGIRTLSICWVVLGHSYIFNLSLPVKNILTLTDLFDPVTFSIITAGPYAVDVFFFLSGLLTFFLITVKLYPKYGWNGFTNFGLLYFHRYYRLIFPMIFCTLIALYVMQYVGDGPLYGLVMNSEQSFRKQCERYWWTNLLFINNLYPWALADECIGWVWYLANDFQFFIISPLIIFVYCRSRIMGYSILYTLIFLCIFYNGFLSGYYNLGPQAVQGDKINSSDYIYNKPWARMSTYLIGAIFGFAYFEKSKKDKYPYLHNTIANKYFDLMTESGIYCYVQAFIGFGMMLLFVIPLRNFIKNCTETNCWSLGTTILFTSFFRVGFIIGMLFVILPTLCNRFTLIKKLLSAEVFIVGARLTYSVYLIHIFLIYWLYSDTRQSFYNTNLYLTFVAIGTVLITFLFAIPFTLIAEAPYMSLEKYILFPAPRKLAKSNDSLVLTRSNADRNMYQEKSQEINKSNKAKDTPEITRRLIAKKQ